MDVLGPVIAGVVIVAGLVAWVVESARGVPRDERARILGEEAIDDTWDDRQHRRG